MSFNDLCPRIKCVFLKIFCTIAKNAVGNHVNNMDLRHSIIILLPAECCYINFHLCTLLVVFLNVAFAYKCLKIVVVCIVERNVDIYSVRNAGYA